MNADTFSFIIKDVQASLQTHEHHEIPAEHLAKVYELEEGWYQAFLEMLSDAGNPVRCRLVDPLDVAGDPVGKILFSRRS